MASVIFLFGLLAMRALALDSVQVWRNPGCQGPNQSWYLIDDDRQSCVFLAGNSNDGGQSYIPVAADSAFQFLYTSTTLCLRTQPAVLIRPTGVSSNLNCVRLNGGHIMSAQVEGSLVQTGGDPGTVVGDASSASSGLGQSPAGARIFFGRREYLFDSAAAGRGQDNDHIPRYSDWEIVRQKIRTQWQQGMGAGGFVQNGQSTTGKPMTYSATYTSLGTSNPFNEYDGANGQLMPGIMERFFYFMKLNHAGTLSATIHQGDNAILQLTMAME